MYIHAGFHTGFFLGGGEDCMGVVGVGLVKHVLPRGVWRHAPRENFENEVL